MKKKSSSALMWLLAAVCFLIFIGGLTIFMTSRNAGEASADVQSRSVTITDAGFDTPITFEAETTEEAYVASLDLVKQIFTHYNALFDRYNEYEGITNIYTLNHEAASQALQVDPAITEVIDISRKAQEINPSFDITEGNLLDLWHDARESENPYVPEQSEIDQAMVHTDISGITVTEDNVVSFADPSISLDLGAIAKGYTAQVAADALKKAGLTTGFINAGGNVVILGPKADGSAWKIGIQKPDTNASIVRFETDQPISLVTSGDYQRYFTVDGKRYSHIIDPKTGYPADFMRSVTVIHPDSAWADAMSTSLFCMPVEDGMEVVENSDLEAIWIVDEGSLDLEPDYTSDGFDVYVSSGIKDQVSLSN